MRISRNLLLPLAAALLAAGNLPAHSGPAPVLTSVTPNPLSVGNATVTIQGTGFLAGALVYDSYGSNSMIQTQPTTVTSTTITVTIYQGAATSSTFCVENPGTVCSNSITVPVGSSASSGGSGGGGSNVPVLTSVTPNPLAVGNATVTIQGTGFQTGALVYDTYGSTSMIQTAPTTVTATTITVAIYQGSATTSTFCVKNPGSACSNSVTVPVTSTGSGGGSGGGGSASVPVLTSVSPNPLGVGNATVTIQGTGFQTGALVYDSYGSNSMIQTQPTTVTATTITVAIYQGAAATSTFCVKNPGTACSNSIAVPVSGSSTGSGGGSPPPPGNYTLTVVNGTISTGGTTGIYGAGTVVSITANAAPAGEYFQTWTGAGLANTGTPSTTVTMPGANTTVTASFYNPPPIPFPVTTHPRLWITQQDLPRLQSWAYAGNVTYQGLTGALGAAIGSYNQAFPGAALNATNPTPASPYPDFGDDNGYTGILSEENAMILAFNSLIDPNPANRSQYAQAARNLLMYAMNQAAPGPLLNVPFRDPSFPISNRASFTGHDWPLVVDWIYNATDANGNAILTATDKATIRNVFMQWAAACLTAETTGGDHPGGPAGAMNNLSLLPGNLPYRLASNNYYIAHARLLTMMSLALDPADDPPVSAALAPSQVGNTLRSYIQDATGAWLYEEFAMMGDPQTVAQAYGVPNNPTGAGFGLASGGLPPEGMLYGESFGYMLGQLLALQTAGFNNVAYSGPQIALIGAPVWDRYVTGYMSSLTPTAKVFPSEAWEGSVFQFASYGDLLRLWVTPDNMVSFSLLALLDQENGQTGHQNAARWFAVNAMQNGASALLSRIANPWTWGASQSILYYMLLDPAAAAATDPRPNYPTLFYDAPAGRVVAHSAWTPDGTMFDYRASWININHQDGNGGMFELFRKGEWLTKEMSNYDAGGNGIGATTGYHNSLALQNYCAVCASLTWQGLDAFEWFNGSQWMENEDAGDPVTSMSNGSGYVYATSDLTNLFNRHGAVQGNPDAIANISQATRSILWLNNDYIVVYDRATSLNAGLFKRFNLALATNPAINGNVATETLASGQQLFIQTLLPQNASITSVNGAAALSWVADLEPTQYLLTVQDPTLPTDTRFLHVLQGADAGASMAAATYLQSNGGTPFDGAVFGGTAVYFPVSASAIFGATTFPAPAGVHTLLVTGLAPNTAYGVGVQAQGAGNVVTVSPGGAGAIADAAGVLLVTF